MSSWGNDPLEAKIDEMLASTVSTGSEPEGFAVMLMPRRPLFPWVSAVSVIVVFAILGYFMAVWLGGQNQENVGYGQIFSFAGLSGLFSGVSTSEFVSGLAVFFGLGGAILTFLPEKQKLLKHLT